MTERKFGLPPIFDTDSRVLILGSFPSVKSREVEFYYGNKQNRFWKMLAEFFKEELLIDVDRKKEFLLRHQIALWDVVASCEIVGSQDSEIKAYELADISTILEQTKIERILLNGTVAYKLFEENLLPVNVPYTKMPSTSPANPRYSKEIWFYELSKSFR